MVDGTGVWWPEIVAAAERVGVPAAGLRALCRRETNGIATVVRDGRTVPIASPSGALGLMQVSPRWWGHLYAQAREMWDAPDNTSLLLKHPEASLWMGAVVWRHYAVRCGSEPAPDWSAAIVAYLSGQCTVDPTFRDGRGTAALDYWRDVARFWREYDPTIELSEPRVKGETMALNMARGLIPLPPVIDHPVDVTARCQGENRGFDWLGPRTIRGVVLHRSQGTWQSNISHFDSFCPGALTDLQVHHQDGRMMRFVELAPPGESVRAPSGWANGRVNGAYGDGKKFLDWWGPRSGIGVNVINRDLESCEITGFFRQPGTSVTADDPVSDACWATLARWIASRAHDYGITHETFPLIPSEGNRSFVIWHQEFTLPAFSLTDTRKICPGRVVIEGTDALIERARAILRTAQTSAPAPTPTPPWPIDLDALPYRDRQGNRWLRLGEGEKRWTALVEAKRHLWADPTSPEVGPPIKPGETVTLVAVVATPRHGVWGISRAGVRVNLDAFLPEKAA